MSAVFARAARIALDGWACRPTSGPATSACATTRAIGVSPRAAAASSLMRTTAAAPSVICEELPAVMVPSPPNAGRSPASDSAVVSARSPSSALTTVGPFRPGTENGSISSAWMSAAAAKRWCDPAAHASCSARAMPSEPLRSSVDDPMERCSKASVNPSWSRVSMSSMAPYRLPARDPDQACGARLIDSWPSATTTSTSPASMRRVPVTIASIPERHTALTVMAGTVKGMSAPTADCLAGFWPAAPCRTCPPTTCCTSVASTPARDSAARIAWAPSSVAGTEANAPLNFTNGVRAYPTMTVLMRVPPEAWRVRSARRRWWWDRVRR